MILAAVGLLATLSQVVLLRELNVAFYGVELVYGLAFAAWMAGGAAGALALPATRGTRRRTSWLLAGVALLVPADVAWIRASRLLLGATPGAYLSIDRQIATLALSLLPPAALLGLAFRWAADEAAARHRSPAMSYAIESLGAVVGAIVATIGLASGAQTLSLALATAGLVPTWLVAANGRDDRHRRRHVARALILAGATAIALSASSRLDLAMTAWSHPSVVETRDSPYARITVTRAFSQVSTFLDDVLVYESETSENERLAHLTALHHPAPTRILLLGGRAEHLDDELARHRPTQLDVVEIDRAILGTVAAGAPVAPLQRQVFIADPRAFLQTAGRYDVIVVGMPPPSSGLTNRFYTREFFGECAAHLAPGGVVGLRLPFSENVVSPARAAMTASVLEALRMALPEVRVFAGDQVVAVASGGALPRDAETLIARLESRHLATRLVTPAYLRYQFADDRREMVDALLHRTGPPNSDGFPACYRYASAIWLSKFVPSVAAIDVRALGVSAWTTAAISFVATSSLLLLALGRRVVRARPDEIRNREGAAGKTVLTPSRAGRTGMLAAVAGFAGVLLETVVLFAYQARSGAVFETLGVLLAAFMVGLAAGSWGFGRAPWNGSARGVLVALALLGAATTTSVVGQTLPGVFVAVGALAAIGTCVGGIFACALAASPGTIVGRLYAADLAGGCVAALLGSLLLVPLAGLAATATVAVLAVTVAGFLAP